MVLLAVPDLLALLEFAFAAGARGFKGPIVTPGVRRGAAAPAVVARLCGAAASTAAVAVAVVLDGGVLRLLLLLLALVWVVGFLLEPVDEDVADEEDAGFLAGALVAFPLLLLLLLLATELAERLEDEEDTVEEAEDFFLDWEAILLCLCCLCGVYEFECVMCVLGKKMKEMCLCIGSSKSRQARTGVGVGETDAVPFNFECTDIYFSHLRRYAVAMSR